MSRPVKLSVVHRGEEHTAFQVLESSSEFDAASGGFAIALNDGILG
jgi:hypothetical protein